MKPLLQNNFLHSGLGDLTSPSPLGAGISDRSLGKNSKLDKSGLSFGDFLRESVTNSRKDAKDVNDKFPDTVSAPRNVTNDQGAVERNERDLVDKRIQDRQMTSAREKMDSNLERGRAEAGQDRKSNVDPENIRQIDKLKTPSKPESASESIRATGQNAPQKEIIESSEAKESLKPLRAAVGGKIAADSLVGNNPVLSFVTGRLDRLEPSGIPGIISSSPFIKQAMSANEVSDLMVQPMPVSELLNMFEIDSSVISKAVVAGLDSSALVTPKDFLAAIGVDPGQVSAEMTLLQQRLPVEGAKSYVDRAKKMTQGTQDIGVELVASVDDSKDVAKSSAEISAESLFGMTPKGPHQNAAPQNQTDLAAQMTVTQRPVGAVPNPGANTSQASQKQINLDSVLGSRPSAINKGQRTDESRDLTSDSLMESLLAGQILGSAVRTQGEAEVLSAGDVVAKIKDSRDQDPLAFVDPFQDLGTELNLVETQTTNFTPTTVGSSMSSLQEQLQANGFVVHSDKASAPIRDEVKLSKEDVSFETSDEAVALDFGKSSDKQISIDHALVRDVVENVSSGTTNFSQSSFSDTNFGESEGRFTDESSVLGGVELKPLSSHGTNKVFEGAVIQSTADNSTQAPTDSQLHSKILQNASLLLKDGGGSMRLDFESKTLGKIDLAIQLSQNQLDVRILTPNEQVRDIINKELSGLRDGLGTQGISLRTVEVGNASQSSNSFAGGQFSHGQSGQQANYNEMKQYAKSFADSFQAPEHRLDTAAASIRKSIPQSWMNAGGGNSRISVRI